ncbi:hypothetical protein [Endozoicomonas ascidiicola]|uniref:hypothetical protein n=1 Tax=Endozoicomonas ascidiicola TaxID=1698521 RepID=UPI00082B5895|nr:hypothetical protein [Endozoicomonas ascidiicola]
MDISRSLIHYSLVHEEFSKSRDLIKGLLPIFAPAIAKHNGEFYNPETFTAELESMYGLKMHPYVAEDIIPKLEAENLLCRTQAGKKAAYINKSEQVFKSNIDQVNIFKELIDAFVQATEVMLHSSGLTMEKVSIEQAFHHRLARLDFINEEFNDKESTEVERLLNYSFSRFIESMSEKDRKYQDILEQAHSGAMIVEVILNLRTPPDSEKKLDNVQILVDAPILIDLLGLADSDLVKYSNELIKQISSSGAKLITTDYYIQEARELIQNSLRNYHNEKRRITDLDRFLLKSSLNFTKTESIVRDLNGSLEKKGIDISASNYINEASTSQRALTLEDEVFSALGNYQNEKAQARDAKSVALVVSKNRYKEINNISEANILFLTKNSRITEQINSYLRRKKIILDGTISPVITDRKLATLLWVMHGGQGKNLVSSELLANCHRAIESKISILKKAKNTLLDISKLDDEGKEHIESIINNKRTAYCLLDKVGGNIDLIRGKDPKDLIEEIIKEITLEQQEISEIEKNKEIERIRNETRSENEAFKKESENKVQALQTRLSVLENSNNHLVKEKSETEKKLALATESIGTYLKTQQEEKFRKIRQAKAISSFFEIITTLLLIFAIFFVIKEISIINTKNPINIKGIILTEQFLIWFAPILITSLNMLLTWRIPDYSLRKITKFVEKKMFSFLLSLRGIDLVKDERIIRGVVHSSSIIVNESDVSVNEKS